MKGCIKVLRDEPPNRVEGLLNALRFVSWDFNVQSRFFHFSDYSDQLLFLLFVVCADTRRNIWTTKRPPSKSNTWYNPDQHNPASRVMSQVVTNSSGENKRPSSKMFIFIYALSFIYVSFKLEWELENSESTWLNLVEHKPSFI